MMKKRFILGVAAVALSCASSQKDVASADDVEDLYVEVERIKKLTASAVKESQDIQRVSCLQAVRDQAIDARDFANDIGSHESALKEVRELARKADACGESLTGSGRSARSP